MTPYDGYFNPLPPDPITVLRGFSSITKHPERQHHHSFYEVNSSDPSIMNVCQRDSIQLSPCASTAAGEKITDKKLSGQIFCCLESVITPDN